MGKTNYVGRAWNGRLSTIDALMAWMYNKDIFSETEKKTKDILFRKYYRYYNDGDTPRGYAHASVMRTETYLEDELCMFIRTVLKKYQGKYSRRAFHRERARTLYNNTGARDTGSNRISGLLDHYWASVYDNRYHVANLAPALEEVKRLQKLVSLAEAKAGELINDSFANMRLMQHKE